jgi:hypothetical protein
VIGQLAQPQLLVAELEHLDAVRLERVGRGSVLAQREHLGRS